MSDDELRGPITGEEPTFEDVPLPNGHRMAVTVQVALEAWSGRNVTGNTLGSPLSAAAIAKGVPDWATISAQEYGGRTGVWRILSTLAEHSIHAAFSTSTLVAERWPDVARAVVDAGHEIVGHGYSQDRAMSDLDEDEDLDVVAGAVKTFLDVTGQRPMGWSSHGSRRGNYTAQNLLKSDYIYTNDFRDADRPYVVAQQGEKRLVSLPRTDEINDMFLFRRNGNPPSVYVEYFKRSFDQLYKESANGPAKVLACVAHSTLIGRPWGASALSECLEYASGFADVWICTRREVAENYLRGSSTG